MQTQCYFSNPVSFPGKMNFYFYVLKKYPKKPSFSCEQQTSQGEAGLLRPTTQEGEASEEGKPAPAPHSLTAYHRAFLVFFLLYHQVKKHLALHLNSQASLKSHDTKSKSLPNSMMAQLSLLTAVHSVRLWTRLLITEDNKTPRKLMLCQSRYGKN